MAEKKFLADIKLVASVVRDGSGNQISLISDERLGVVHASGGPTTQVNPLTTKSYVDTAITNATSNLLAGLKWRDPVNFVGYKYPVAAAAPGSPVEGDKYVKTTDAKLYTYTSSAWDAGVQLANGTMVVDVTTGNIYTVTAGALNAGTAPTDGDRYVDLVSDKIFTYVTNTWDAGFTPTANVTVVSKDTDGTWTFDGDTSTWIRTDVNSLPIATTSTYGKVLLAANGGVTAGTVVQANDSRLIKGYYYATLTGTGTMELTHNLNSSNLIVQVWKSDEQIEVGIAKTAGSETTKLDISVHGASGDVQVYVIALP